MEPIKINIEVNLGNATLEVLKTLAQGVTGHPNEATKPEPAEAQPEKKAEKKAQPMPAPGPAPQPEPAPKTTGADPIGTGAEDDDDLPPADEPAPKAVPTEHDARLAVKAAKERKVTASAIKAFMKDTFGIATSVECPPERRQELIEGLNKLTA